MSQPSKKIKSPLDKSEAESFPDDITRQRIDQHLKDFHDTISDDDIRNINTDIQTETEEDR